MAEAWLEEEEEELRELRDSAGGRRNRRASANPATDRSERNKPEYRFSGQGALSSIRAAIKRTSRTTAQSEPQRERRRPEITIVAAEPLGPAWFPSGCHGTSGSLAYPPPASQWRNEPGPAELPPSYEQVIKEINRVQVNTSTSNAVPKITTTSATQTDFPEDADGCTPDSSVNRLVPCEVLPVPQPLTPPKPPRPSVPPLTSLPEENVPPLTTVQEKSQDDPSVGRCPMPKPRSKSNLRPLVTDGHQEDFQEEIYPSSARRDLSPSHLQPHFEDNFLDDQVLMDSMSTGSNQSSVVSRIKAFESQSGVENSGLGRKPDIAPRSFVSKPALPVTKPIPAPKPAANRVSGEWECFTERKPKAAYREPPCLLPKPNDLGLGAFSKPELPKKPQPNVITSESPELESRLAFENSNGVGERKFPVPAPRPLLPKKPASPENPASWTAALKPIPAGPRLSVASQAKAFASLGEETTVNRSTSAVQSRAASDWDLISFEDDFNPVSPVAEEFLNSDKSPDPFVSFSKTEPLKEQPVAPALLRKPTVIRIPSKPSKSLSEDLQYPPPLPSEKPIGVSCSDADERSSNSGRMGMGNREADKPGWAEGAWALPALPKRPTGGKVVPAQPAAQKGAPGRPPPPKVSSSRARGQQDSFHRSSSDAGLSMKNTKTNMKRSKSQLLRKQEPELPPRPKPGHLLYSKYMDRNSACKNGDSDTPHALVLHDFSGENSDDLSLTAGEFVQLLEKLDDEWYQGHIKGRTGMFPASFVKVLVDVPGPDNCKQKSLTSITGPRCMARFEFSGEQDGELSFVEGEIIRLKEYVNEEWAKGELKGQVGIFPLNFVEVVEDLPSTLQSVPAGSGLGAQLHSKRDSWGSDSQNNCSSGDWYEALYDFTAETDKDLPFRKGERILITEQLDSEWYRGRVNSREGLVPKSFVQAISDVSQPSQQPRGQKKSKAKALYDFNGENEDELTFKAGSMITVLKYIDDDWMSGELQGRSGMFPRNFVQVL
ncbi:SH3 domain-containing protein 19 isoform X2 [Pleurodeles waltl]|uniref:SH3 domain-containing protein 19 isoform X2 n=1 Tax=Pleurodeles waltl TaxID=8319 RepID=UPI003709BB5E